MKKIKFYANDDIPDMVIKYIAPSDIYVFRNCDSDWVKLPPDNKYLRELFLGQGNNCMTEIFENEAHNIIERILN